MPHTPIDDQAQAASGADAALALPHGEPRPGLYRHYKGGMYRVLGLVRHSESREILVLYQALYGTRGLWVRPRAMFTETVPHGGAAVPRFAPVAEAAQHQPPGLGSD